MSGPGRDISHVVLLVSASACAFPLIATKVPRLRVPPRFLFFVRHFGTGVLLATAFAHLFPTAFVNLTDPCLGSFWTDDYPALAGVIALAAVFAVATIEQVFSPGRHCMTVSATEHGSAVSLEAMRETPRETASPNPPSLTRSETEPARPGPLYGRTKFGRSDSTGQHLARMTTQSAQLDRIERQAPAPDLSPIEDDDNNDNITHRKPPTINPDLPEKTQQPSKLPDPEAQDADPEITPDQKRQKLLLQCILLEVGILFHSVFIGMALAVATGNDFIVLLLAIIFHQTFEGLALGSRIAAVGWSRSRDGVQGWRRYQPWLMALAYGCTTPLGQALGIATHTLYAPESRTGLLMVGVMNAISAGLLTYTSLIDLLAEDFLSDESWRAMKGRKRVVAGLVVVAGAGAMSLIGAWA
ncbi:uncharacterized protein HMPREF1541_09277 [Cyphellophora europaea CBS 101466]|uniref:Zinc/iron permease n=1 Tax=Cyphellophora europaea (strain CBS 101466) TaxID=1220924 RepID=W2S9Q1_CYPE1|nr:uncharacterized protein HMPREF1541_09277 [Cyphellophora europaea CBS 101466]ETN45446.1 hypothetical protein HMPREF1541_09277 [Cyphellophora europaea CBS 101466]